jgi:hypothetical protein
MRGGAVVATPFRTIITTTAAATSLDPNLGGTSLLRSACDGDRASM